MTINPAARAFTADEWMNDLPASYADPIQASREARMKGEGEKPDPAEGGDAIGERGVQ